MPSSGVRASLLSDSWAPSPACRGKKCRRVGSQPPSSPALLSRSVVLASLACADTTFTLLLPHHGKCHATLLIVLPLTPDPSARRRVLIGPLCTTCDGCCRRTAIVSRRINIRPTRTRHKGPLRAEAIITDRSLPRGNNRRGALSRDPICLGWSVCWQSRSPAASTAPWWCTRQLVQPRNRSRGWRRLPSHASVAIKRHVLGGCRGPGSWGEHIDTFPFHLQYTRAGPLFQGRSLGRSAWAHGCSRRSGPIARPVCCASQMACLVLMRKRGVDSLCKRESHMRDLGRYVGAFQIAGFGPCLCATFALLLFCFLCMLQPSTDLCAYTARGN